MLMKNLKFLTALLMVLGSGATLVGCGDDDTSGSSPGFTCGTGTKEENGTCVPDGTTEPGKTCGAGTVAQGDQCVAQNTNTLTCGAGTREENGACVPTDPGGPDITCGPGTVNDGNDVCVPENSFTCGEGTVAQGDVCVRVCPDGTVANANGGCDVEIPPPDLDAICSPGTYQFEGRCLSYDELVREQAAEVITSSDAAATQDDPFIYNFVGTDLIADFGLFVLTGSTRAAGTANTFTLPAEGATTILEGSVSLLGDITGDNIEEQDWDVYAFSATAGQVINLSVASEGFQVPYVEVLRFDGVNAAGDIATELADIAAFDDAQAFLRLTPLSRGTMANRKVLIPTNGLYFIRVTDGFFTPSSQAAYCFDFDSLGYVIQPECEPGTEYICDDVDEQDLGCPEGTALQFILPGTSSGGPGYDYHVGVETLPSVDLAALNEILLNGTSSATWQGDKDSYGRLDTEIALVRKESADPNGEPGFLEVEVNTYDDKAYGTGILTIGDATNTARTILGIGAEGLRFSIPVPPEGWVVGHDHVVAQGYADVPYSVSLRAAPELTDGVAFVSSMEDAGTGLIGFSRDHFLRVPKGSVAEVTASNVGAGVTPLITLWSVAGIDNDFTTSLIACAGDEAVVAALGFGGFCDAIPAGQPLSVARYFPGDASEIENVSVIILDTESGEGVNFGFTLTPTILTPSMLSLDDTTGTVTATVNAGSLNAQTGNTTRWSVLSVTPGTDIKSLEIESSPNAGSNAVLSTTLYTQTDPSDTADGTVLSVGRATAAAAGAATTITLTSPAAPTNYLIKNSVGATSGQSADPVTVDAALTAIPTLAGTNDLCANAEVVAVSGSYIVDLFDAAANYTSTIRGGTGGDPAGITAGCTDPNGIGQGLAFGWPSSVTAPDSFFRVTIPANSTLTIEAGGTGNGDDTILLVVRDSATVCTDLTTKNSQAVCLVADDDSLGGASGFFSRAAYNNNTAAAIDAVVVVKNWVTASADGDANTVSFSITPN